MAKWVWPVATGLVTSATGVALNLATDLRDEPVSWIAVVVLTALGIWVARRSRSHEIVSHAPAVVVGSTTVSNDVPGVVNGNAVQGVTVGPVTFNPTTNIDQTAVAHDGGTVHQAGRDINGGT
ncbi:hypothetical protein [Saccharothrix violaceirubra]|uniref:Uncharacterized membrane protein YjjB (DUF3815 family) n=1 Tax=Saccharothrix violaceirubra TaxID=413306 RepID=A0A7W7T058_9PSEU|nr:hypothetical protein [Saccharothrix violaceirubra]MBB4964045.1 uncharacterized membrane protein YjjB (DUF3815 family) [Saccharothrix violaceirubra]